MKDLKERLCEQTKKQNLSPHITRAFHAHMSRARLHAPRRWLMITYKRVVGIDSHSSASANMRRHCCSCWSQQRHHDPSIDISSTTTAAADFASAGTGTGKDGGHDKLWPGRIQSSKHVDIEKHTSAFFKKGIKLPTHSSESVDAMMEPLPSRRQLVGRAWSAPSAAFYDERCILNNAGGIVS